MLEVPPKGPSTEDFQIQLILNIFNYKAKKQKKQKKQKKTKKEKCLNYFEVSIDEFTNTFCNLVILTHT